MTFSIPLTFHNTTFLDDFSSTAIEATLLRSKQTAFKAWTSNGEENGVAIGCEDGTVYVFRGRRLEEGPSGKPPPVEKRKKRSQSRLQPRPSRPSSPGLPNPLSPTFAVTPRAQVVLGVSTEQAQAPRNYVDFDSESERLKDILKGKNPRERERVSSESVSLVTITPAPSTIIADRIASSAMSLMSVDSSSTRPPSPSLPPSPKATSLDAAQGLSLQCHIVPMHAGHGHAVRSLELLEGNTLLVALHESGYLAIYSSRDGHCLASDYCGDHTSRDVWAWCSLQVAVVDGAQLLLATAATDSSTSAATPDMDENSVEKSQTVLLKLAPSSTEMRIETMAHCSIEGPANGVGVHHEKDGSSTLFYIDSQGHFLLRALRPPASPSILSSPDTPPVPESDSIASLTVPLARSFKSIVGRSADTLSLNQSIAQAPPSPPSQLILNEAVDAGSLISDSTVTGLSARSVDGKLYTIVWAHHEMTVFEYHSFALRIILQTQVEELRNVEWLDDVTYALLYEDHIDVFRLECTNADGEHVHRGLEDHEGSLYSPSRILRIFTGACISSSFSPLSEIVESRITPKGYLQIASYNVDPRSLDKPHDGPALLWQSSIRKEDVASSVFQTSSVPLELEVIIQGFSDGRIRQYTLEQMTFKTTQALITVKQSEPAVPGAIVGLHITLNPRTKEKYVLGGADDGSILFWNLSTFTLCARWMVFSTPLIRAVEFQDNAGPLRGCVLCIAQDGTVAVIAVDGFQFLYMIPGAPSPLLRVSLGETNLVLVYGGNIVRLWDIRTKEFWRSTTVDRAEEMFKQGGWTSLDIDSGASIPASLWTTVAPAFDGTDAAATLEFALDKFITECVSLTKTISTSRDEVRSVLHALDRLRYVLSIMITPGLNSDVDSICTGKLQLHPSSAGVGLSSPGTTTIYSAARPHDPWTISGNVTAARMLAVVFVLKAMSLFEELSEAANSVIAFYTLSLPACVGSHYVPPSLEWLGKRWFASAPDLRQSIRAVFDATLHQTSDQDAMRLAEKWQQHLPSLLPLAEQEGETAALALIICGSIATEKFTLLSISALTDISKSLTLYLHDEKSTHRALAIDMCSKGFHVWQHYVDTMEILRALFTLATNVRKDSITPQNLSAQARIAVVNIATNHTPLFMSTLCLDVLSPPTLDHRRAVMQIIAFLIRKRRHILQPNLPRLMEAVVKSLDPNANADREAVLATATEIIAFVVKNFQSVDFHMSSQRLAVGTNEGAVVMYDLKTAIRLYVLEGHKRQLTACSFSPDGRRLVTLSLAEQAVLVWKVGTSFSSFFNPGAPPRQGHGGSDPFKTLNFNIGDEVVMTIEETLDLVRFEWVADRSVKVKIRDSILTFST